MEQELVSVIKEVGVTVVGLIACAWYIYKINTRVADEAKEREQAQREDNREIAKTLDKSTDVIQENTEINRELSETNRMLVQGMKDELNCVGKNVEKILENTKKKGD